MRPADGDRRLSVTHGRVRLLPSAARRGGILIVNLPLDTQAVPKRER